MDKTSPCLKLILSCKPAANLFEFDFNSAKVSFLSVVPSINTALSSEILFGFEKMYWKIPIDGISISEIFDLNITIISLIERENMRLR